MADEITFGNTTLWGCDTGAGWNFTPASIQTEVIEKQAPLGTGYWIKPKGEVKADLKLELKWLAADIEEIISTVEDIDQTDLATLGMPQPWGNYSNCRLSSIGDWNIESVAADNKYLLAVALTFTKYP